MLRPFRSRGVRALRIGQVAALVCIALAQEACVAHGLAGIGSNAGGSEQLSVPPAESDARLTCGGEPCAGAPLEKPYKVGRSKATFWLTFTAEMLLLVGGTAALGSSATVPGLVAMEVGFWTGLCDIISYARSDEYGRQTQPPRLGKPLLADWRGMRVPITISEVVPPGSILIPDYFSVAVAARHLGLGQSEPAPAARPAGTRLSRGKVAVLDLRSSTAELGADQLRYFGDLVRGATLKAAPQLEVMTRENLLVLLQASGKDLANCEGECEVETGRRIGADAIISGEVLKIGTRYKLMLRLHDTHEGQLVGAAVASGTSIEELDDSANKAVTTLFEGAR